MSTAFLLVCAMCLDAALGEPDWLWSRIRHPAVMIGNIIGWLDERLNKGTGKRLKGIAVVLLLVEAPRHCALTSSFVRTTLYVRRIVLRTYVYTSRIFLPVCDRRPEWTL